MRYTELQVGDKILFVEEKRPYIVKACSEYFAICTKPFNVINHVIYTILDFQRNKRGPNNLIFNMYDYMIQEDIEKCLSDLHLDPIVEVSYRRSIEIRIMRVVRPEKVLFDYKTDQ